MAYLANSSINPIHMVELTMGDTCVYIPIKGWGLFILEDVQAEEPLLPFIGPYYALSEYNKLSPYYPCLKHYALNGHDKCFIGSDVEKGNVAGYSSSNQRLEN